jgi:EAL domain-containing protein (putative c-di-GMP-specific phosphodiesterase class I)
MVLAPGSTIADQELLADLRHAVSRRQLRVVAQPIASCTTGLVVGAEALVRWDHPTLGTLPPAAFIPLAEAEADGGLVGAIGAWVLDEAVRQLVAVGSPRAHVAVNAAATQIADPSFVAIVTAAVHRHRLGPGRLVIEITEPSLLVDLDAAREVVTALHALGVGVALDDFGTGHSSLAYLQRLPVDVVKIDRRFVAGLADDARDRAIVASVIELARALDTSVCAEGVDNPAQLDVLRRLGCPLYQGYLLSRPVPLDQSLATSRAS